MSDEINNKQRAEDNMLAAKILTDTMKLLQGVLNEHDIQADAVLLMAPRHGENRIPIISGGLDPDSAGDTQAAIKRLLEDALKLVSERPPDHAEEFEFGPPKP